MRRLSLFFTAPGKVSIEESPISSPATDQIMVKTIVSAISPGTEMLIYRGQFPRDAAIDETIPSLKGEFSFPMKYGYAAVGEVAQIGNGIDKGWEGKTVFSFHPHESQFLCEAKELVPLPSGISPEFKRLPSILLKQKRRITVIDAWRFLQNELSQHAKVKYIPLGVGSLSNSVLVERMRQMCK